MDPAVFAQKSWQTSSSGARQAHTQPGPVRVDTVRYTDEAVVSDLEAVSRHPAQDAYMTFADEKFCVVDEVPGNELQLEPVRAALREAVSGLTVSTDGAQNVSFELTSVPDCYAAPEITAENTSFDFDELLRQMLKDLNYTIDLNLEGQSEQEKIVTLKDKELSELLSVDKDGSVKVDEKKLDALLAGWKAIADVSNTPFILDTYVDGPKPMNFLKVDYQLDTDALSQQLQQALKKLESKDLRAQLLLYKNGEPYAPLTDVYVEVDIDNQRLTVYKNGEVVTSTDIVTGNLNGFQTITGLYYAYNKETDQWMQGEDYLVFSKYWIGIEGAYGLARCIVADALRQGLLRQRRAAMAALIFRSTRCPKSSIPSKSETRSFFSARTNGLSRTQRRREFFNRKKNAPGNVVSGGFAVLWTQPAPVFSEKQERKQHIERV